MSPDEEGQSFLYQALGEGFEFPGFRFLTIPTLNKKILDDWALFESWCDSIEDELMSRLLDGIEGLDSKKTLPRHLFKTKKILFEKLEATLCSPEIESGTDVMSVKIESDGKSLHLIYIDSDGWTLGHSDSVFVVDSPNELTRELGFYPIRY